MKQLLCLADGRYLCQIALGDVCGDGHEQYTDYLLASNLPVVDLVFVALRIPEELGINFERDFFRYYGDSTLRPEQLKRLEPLGVRREDLLVYTEKDEEDSVQDGRMVFRDPEVLLYIWIQVLRFLEPSLQVEILRVPDLNRLIPQKYNETFTMGYGLYDSSNY